VSTGVAEEARGLVAALCTRTGGSLGRPGTSAFVGAGLKNEGLYDAWSKALTIRSGGRRMYADCL
jgi:hypothetical protein